MELYVTKKHAAYAGFMYFFYIYFLKNTQERFSLELKETCVTVFKTALPLLFLVLQRSLDT